MDGLVIEPGFWAGRRVFLTGHTGFKGAWLSLWLGHLGAEIFGFSLPPPTDPSLYEAASVAGLVGTTTGDVRDLVALRRAVDASRPEVVFHLAAQPLVLRSYAEPVETFATNVMGTVNLLEALRGSETVRAVVIVTSDKCYENAEWSWGYRESDPVGGRDPYSSSKGCAELVTAAYRASFFAQVSPRSAAGIATARAGNVIGGGDWAVGRLIPDIVRSIFAGNPAEIRHPDAVRPWQHVLEPLSGYLRLAHALWQDPVRYSGAWNFGPADVDTWQVAALVRELCELWGDGASWRATDATPFHEAHLLKLDSSRARMGLGWSSVWTVRDALRATVEWYKTYRAGLMTQDRCREQIECFQRASMERGTDAAFAKP